MLDDSPTALRDTPLTIAAPGLLANDGDLSARPLTAELVGAPAPAHGTVSLQPDGGFTFTPAAGFTGLATFTYRPLAGGIAGAPATVGIRVASPAPSGQNGMLSAASFPAVADTTPPVVSVPTNITLEATGPSGAVRTGTRTNGTRGEASFGRAF